MAMYKEIVTKAVVGKAKKYFKNSYSLETTNEPTTVLGCWVINHQFKGYKQGEKIGVDGSYDINIWYSYENDTKTTVVNKKIKYNDMFSVKTSKDADLTSDTEIIVRTLSQPNCVGVTIGKNNTINFDVEKELGVEVVGETKMKIAIEEDEEPWEDLNIEETTNDEIVKDIDNEIDENYIK